jgi:hypothetical protein
MSDHRTREECLQDIEDARARLKQLRTLDIWVYAIKRTWKGETRYRTRVRGLGWRQVLALDLDHPALWLAASKHWAEDEMEAMTKRAIKGATYEIVRVAKSALPNLPCWPTYRHLEEFGGTP